MSKKIKIAVNARFLIQDKLEGIGTYSHQVLSRLVKLLPHVEFHFLFDRPHAKEFVYSSNVIPHQIGFPARHPFLWCFWFEISVSSWLKKNKVDYFVSTDSFLSLKTEVDTLLVMHDLAFEHFPKHNGFLVRNYYKHYFPKFAKKAKDIIAVSKFTKRDIVEKYQINSEKIELGYCGVSGEYKTISTKEKQVIKTELSQNQNYFICIGSLNPRKNISSAVKAFNLFKEETGSDFKLLIVGANGWKTEKLFNEIELSNFKTDIIRTGHLKPELLSKYLAASEALVFPSLFEGFGIPIVEAMKCKVPIITSNVSSTLEIGKGIAFLVDPKSIIEIKNAMISITKKHSFSIEEEILIEKKLSLYNWDKTALKFRDIITKRLALKAF